MLKSDNCLLLLIDIQEKLVKMLSDALVVSNCEKLLKTTEILNIPSIVTEQYPKGLGKTLENIKNANKQAEYYEKTDFSAISSPEIFEAIKKQKRKQIILGGIESHICVLQTALELLEKGFEVFVVVDACASRKDENFKNAIFRLAQAGAIISDTEITLFELLKTSKHHNFKEIQSLIK